MVTNRNWLGLGAVLVMLAGCGSTPISLADGALYGQIKLKVNNTQDSDSSKVCSGGLKATFKFMPNKIIYDDGVAAYKDTEFLPEIDFYVGNKITVQGTCLAADGTVLATTTYTGTVRKDKKADGSDAYIEVRNNNEKVSADATNQAKYAPVVVLAAIE